MILYVIPSNGIKLHPMRKHISMLFKVPMHINSTTTETSLGTPFPAPASPQPPARHTCCVGRGVAECMRAGH